VPERSGVLSAERMADFLPLLHRERLRLAALEFAAVHDAGPGEADGYELGEVTESLLHAGFAFGIAVEKNRDDTAAGPACDLGGFGRLLPRDRVRAEGHGGDAESVDPDNVVGTFDDDQAEARGFGRRFRRLEYLLAEEFDAAVEALHDDGELKIEN